MKLIGLSDAKGARVQRQVSQSSAIPVWSAAECATCTARITFNGLYSEESRNGKFVEATYKGNQRRAGTFLVSLNGQPVFGSAKALSTSDPRDNYREP